VPSFGRFCRMTLAQPSLGNDGCQRFVSTRAENAPLWLRTLAPMAWWRAPDTGCTVGKGPHRVRTKGAITHSNSRGTGKAPRGSSMAGVNRRKSCPPI